MDNDFAYVWADLMAGHTHASYVIKDGYLMKNNCLCIVSKLRPKLAKGILPTTRMIKSIYDEIFVADEYVRDLDIAFAQVRTPIEHSQMKHKKAADKHRRQMDIKENDLVLLKFEKARLSNRPCHEGAGSRLSTSRFYGPFKVIKKIDDVTFGLLHHIIANPQRTSCKPLMQGCGTRAWKIERGRSTRSG